MTPPAEFGSAGPEFTVHLRRKSRSTPTGIHGPNRPEHAPHHRALIPVEQVTQLHSEIPSACQQCHEPLGGLDPQPQRHQVVEVPLLSAHVSEYRLHRLRCRRCGSWTRAALSTGVSPSSFGPRLTALVALCTGTYRLSKRNLEQFLSDVLGIKLSVGSVSALEQRVSQSLQPSVQQALAQLPQQPVANMDETSWRQSQQKSWIWVVVTAVVTVFRIAKTRGSVVCKELLGDAFSGTLCTDRWSAYNYIPLGQRQLCWAHLLRDFQKLVDAGGDGARLGQELLRLSRRLMHLWHRVCDGTLPFALLAPKTRSLRLALQQQLREGALFYTGKARTLSRELLRKEVALWRFTTQPGVEPTNNAAERALRHAVLWRRGSFGTQSRAGSDFVVRILTVSATLRQQSRCVLEYLTQACTAALAHQPPPSLLHPSCHPPG